MFLTHEDWRRELTTYPAWDKWLVYADWLEERGTEAEHIRRAVEIADLTFLFGMFAAENLRVSHFGNPVPILSAYWMVQHRGLDTDRFDGPGFFESIHFRLWSIDGWFVPKPKRPSSPLVGSACLRFETTKGHAWSAVLTEIQPTLPGGRCLWRSDGAVAGDVETLFDISPIVMHA